MTQTLSINKNGTISVYTGGRKTWSGPVSELVAYLSTVPAPKAKKIKPPSRGQRWSDATSAAVQALETLEEIRGEFEEWKDNLPENLQQSALGEKLDAVVDLDIQSALDTANEADSADLPLGFGRD